MKLTTLDLEAVVFRIRQNFSPHAHYIQQLNLIGTSRWYVVRAINDQNSVLDVFKDGHDTPEAALQAWGEEFCPKCEDRDPMDLLLESKQAAKDLANIAARKKEESQAAAERTIAPLLSIINAVGSHPANPCDKGSLLHHHVSVSRSDRNSQEAMVRINLSCGAAFIAIGSAGDVYAQVPSSWIQ